MKLYWLLTINLTILAQYILGLYSVKGPVSIIKNYRQVKITTKEK